ncbi:2TM domain-containing protein [Leptothoe sp. EHU-05/26/07-4]
MAEGYSAEQVQQILVTAMGQRQEDGFSRSQLIEMATDLGISPEVLQQAEQTLQQVPVPKQSVSMQASKRQKFQQSLKTYAVVNAFLLALNVTLSGTITWAIYPLLGWGLGLLLPEDFLPCTKTQSWGKV